jgi:hypothetical protein
MCADFFDDDLTPAGVVRKSAPEADGQPVVKINSEASQARMQRQKEQLSSQVADSTDEIERLRMRQEDLAKEKMQLESLARKQEEYEKGKHDVIERLERSIVQIEKEEVQAMRMVEVLSVMRDRFSISLAELKKLDESSWADEVFLTELNKAQAVVEESKSLYKRGMAKMEAMRLQDGGTAKAGGGVSLSDGTRMEANFSFWFMAGLAFCIPLVVVIIIVSLIYFISSRSGVM